MSAFFSRFRDVPRMSKSIFLKSGPQGDRGESRVAVEQGVAPGSPLRGLQVNAITFDRQAADANDGVLVKASGGSRPKTPGGPPARLTGGTRAILKVESMLARTARWGPTSLPLRNRSRRSRQLSNMPLQRSGAGQLAVEARRAGAARPMR